MLTRCAGKVGAATRFSSTILFVDCSASGSGGSDSSLLLLLFFQLELCLLVLALLLLLVLLEVKLNLLRHTWVVRQYLHDLVLVVFVQVLQVAHELLQKGRVRLLHTGLEADEDRDHILSEVLAEHL
jgi:hypothetical protein